MDFQKLIRELKNDLKSLPSVDGSREHRAIVIGDEQPEKKKCVELVAVWYHHPVAQWGIQNLSLGIEFFLFFIVFLSIIKPPFLYVRQRRTSNRNEVVRSRFSIIYLLFYSMFFTVVIHGLIWIHSFLVQKYLP